MKSIIYLLVAFSLWGCFGKRPTLNTGHEGKAMPSIDLLGMDSLTHINLKKDSSDKPVVLFYFSPECPYCRALTKAVIKDAEELKGINIYMLSAFPFNEVKGYYKEFSIAQYPNITMGVDYQTYFSKYFKSPGVPCLAIYGKQKTLKEVLMGNVSTNLIKDLAFE